MNWDEAVQEMRNGHAVQRIEWHSSFSFRFFKNILTQYEDEEPMKLTLYKDELGATDWRVVPKKETSDPVSSLKKEAANFLEGKSGKNAFLCVLAAHIISDDFNQKGSSS